MSEVSEGLKESAAVAIWLKDIIGNVAGMQGHLSEPLFDAYMGKGVDAIQTALKRSEVELEDARAKLQTAMIKAESENVARRWADGEGKVEELIKPG